MRTKGPPPGSDGAVIVAGATSIASAAGAPSIESDGGAAPGATTAAPVKIFHTPAEPATSTVQSADWLCPYDTTCTACGERVEEHEDAARHAELGVLVDAACRMRALAKKTVDEEGFNEECSWCGYGDGTDVIMCSKCPRVYCTGCMVRNLGSAYCDKLELGPEDEEWQCPHCNRAPIKEHQDACSLVLKWPDDVEKADEEFGKILHQAEVMLKDLGKKLDGIDASLESPLLDQQIVAIRSECEQNHAADSEDVGDGDSSSDDGLEAMVKAEVEAWKKSQNDWRDRLSEQQGIIEELFERRPEFNWTSMNAFLHPGEAEEEQPTSPAATDEGLAAILPEVPAGLEPADDPAYKAAADAAIAQGKAGGTYFPKPTETELPKEKGETKVDADREKNSDEDDDDDGDSSDDGREAGDSDWEGEDAIHELVPRDHDFSGIDLQTRDGTISRKKLAKLYKKEDDAMKRLGKSGKVTQRLKPEDYSANKEIATNKRRRLRAKKKKAKAASAYPKRGGKDKRVHDDDASFIDDSDDDDGGGGLGGGGDGGGSGGLETPPKKTVGEDEEQERRVLCTGCGKPDVEEGGKHPLFNAPACQSCIDEVTDCQEEVAKGDNCCCCGTDDGANFRLCTNKAEICKRIVCNTCYPRLNLPLSWEDARRDRKWHCPVCRKLEVKPRFPKRGGDPVNATPKSDKKKRRKIREIEKLTKDEKEEWERERIERTLAAEKARKLAEEAEEADHSDSDDDYAGASNSSGATVRINDNVLVVDEEEPIFIHAEISRFLKPHQVEGIRFMWHRLIKTVADVKRPKDRVYGGILAHAMGLGKTLQTITCIYTVLTCKVINKQSVLPTKAAAGGAAAVSAAVGTSIGTVLVIVPKNVLMNWHKEFVKWIPDKAWTAKYVQVLDGTKVKDIKARSERLKLWHETGGVMIMTDGMYVGMLESTSKAQKYSEVIRGHIKERAVMYLQKPGPDMLFLDEGHLISSEVAKRSAAIKGIQTRRRMILTGTPLQNNLTEYFFMIDFIRPKYMGTKDQFNNRFTNPIGNGQYADSTQGDILQMKRRLCVLQTKLSTMVQRKDQKVLLNDLKGKTEYVLYVSLTKEQRKLYRRYNAFAARHSDDGSAGKGYLAAFQALQKVSSHPYTLHMKEKRKRKKSKAELEKEKEEQLLRQFDDVISVGRASNAATPTAASTDSDVDDDAMQDEDEEDKEDNGAQWLRGLSNKVPADLLADSAKFKLFFDILRLCDAKDDKLVLFTQHVVTLDVLELQLKRMKWVKNTQYLRIDGKDESTARLSMADKFNKDGSKLKLIIASLKATSLGINFTGANRVVIFDHSHNPTHEIQAIARTYRYGQTKEVVVYRFVADRTIDQKVYVRQCTKLAMSRRVVDDDNMKRMFSDAERKSLQDLDRAFESEDESEDEDSEESQGAAERRKQEKEARIQKIKDEEEAEGKKAGLKYLTFKDPSPKDQIMAELLKTDNGKQIKKYHTQSQVLVKLEDEEHDAEFVKAAEKEFADNLLDIKTKAENATTLGKRGNGGGGAAGAGVGAGGAVGVAGAGAGASASAGTVRAGTATAERAAALASGGAGGGSVGGGAKKPSAPTASSTTVANAAVYQQRQQQATGVADNPPFSRSCAMFGMPDGMTPLMTAAKSGDMDRVARYILEGHDVDATNNKGQTAYTMAAESGHALRGAVTSFLEQASNAVKAKKASVLSAGNTPLFPFKQMPIQMFEKEQNQAAVQQPPPPRQQPPPPQQQQGTRAPPTVYGTVSGPGQPRAGSKGMPPLPLSKSKSKSKSKKRIAPTLLTTAGVAAIAAAHALGPAAAAAAAAAAGVGDGGGGGGGGGAAARTTGTTTLASQMLAVVTPGVAGVYRPAAIKRVASGEPGGGGGGVAAGVEKKARTSPAAPNAVQLAARSTSSPTFQPLTNSAPRSSPGSSKKDPVIILSSDDDDGEVAWTGRTPPGPEGDDSSSSEDMNDS